VLIYTNAHTNLFLHIFFYDAQVSFAPLGTDTVAPTVISTIGLLLLLFSGMVRKAWQCECGFCSSDQDNFSEHVCLKPTITPTLVSVPRLPVGAALPPCISRSHISRGGHTSTASASASTSSIIGNSNIMNSNNNNSSRSSNDGAPALLTRLLARRR
jgi:hypothetical protein